MRKRLSPCLPLYLLGLVAFQTQCNMPSSPAAGRAKPAQPNKMAAHFPRRYHHADYNTWASLA